MVRILLRLVAFDRVMLVPAFAAMAVGAAQASAAPGKPDPGRYTGNIGAGFPVHFVVSSSGKTITGLTTDFEGTVNCGPPADDPPYFHFPTLTIDDGAFKGTTVEDAGSDIAPVYTIKGHFTTPGRAEGTIHVSFSFPHNALPPCNETDSFSAKRAD
jgi:hypothetical protein